MATGKQERNGADEMAPIGATMPSDWQSEIAGRKAQAQTAGETYAGYGHTVMTGFTAQTNDLTIGNTWSWDDGLAVGELPGEWSDQNVTANSSPNANTPSNVVGTVDGTPEWVQ